MVFATSDDIDRILAQVDPRDPLGVRDICLLTLARHTGLRVSELIGLDVFDVVAGQGDQPGEVRVGRYVTNDIFLSIAQEFGSRVGQAATVEYRLRPRLSIRLSTSTSG